MSEVVLKINSILLLVACSLALVSGQPRDNVSHELISYARMRPDTAFSLLTNRLSEARKQKNTPDEAFYLLAIGDVLFNSGTYIPSIEYLLQAKKISGALQDTYLTGVISNHLGKVFYYNRQPQMADASFREAFSLLKDKKNKSGLSETYSGIGHIYEKRGVTDSAIYYQRLALNLALQYSDTILFARIYESLGSVFEDLSMFDSAYMYFSKANNLYELLGNPVEQIEVINNIGDVYRKTGRVAEGLAFTRTAIQLAKNYNNLYQLNAAYKDVGKAFELLGRFDSAYFYMDESREVMQQLYMMENTTKMALMQAVFDTERKDAEIEKLLQHKKNNTQILIAGAVVFMLLLFLFYSIYTRQRVMMETQLQLRKHKEIIHQKEKSLINAELRNKELQEEKLKQELSLKGRELSSQLLHLVQKNQLLEEIKTAVTQIIKDEKRDQKKQLKGLLQKIQESYSGDQYWEEFRNVFDQLHESFFTRLQQKSPHLTPTDIRIISLIKMNLTPLEIYTLLGITPDSLRVSRYRIKKKLQLPPEESLSGFLHSL